MPFRLLSSRFVASALLLGLPGAAVAQFADRTVENGLTWRGSTWGAAMADVDLDGDLDLYAAHHIALPILFWNNGMGEFSAATHPQPWTGPTDRHGAVILSLDADKDPEIFVTHGADGGAGSEPNELYRNDGGVSLRYLLGAGGMSDGTGRPRSASAADYNHDGRPDIFTGEAPQATSPNSLFRNNGNLVFTDVAASMGLNEVLGTIGGVWGDMDDDGDPDLLVGGEESSRPTKLFRNDGGIFTDATAILSPPPPVASGADWGDLDGDGDLDLALVSGNLGVFDGWVEADSLTYYFNTRYADTGLDGLTIPCTSDTVWAVFRILAQYDTTAIFLGPDRVHPTTGAGPIPLTDAYVGEPTFTPGVNRGTFVWRASAGGPWEVRCSTPSVNYDTFDGYLTAHPPLTGATPVSLEDPLFPPGTIHVWRNDGGAFAEISTELGFTAMVNPRDVSCVDYDNDGDLDLHVVDMGTSGEPNAPDRLYRNDGPGLPLVDVAPSEGATGGTAGLGDGGIWGDIDGDLDLDLFLQEGAGPATFFTSDSAHLLLNKGDRGHAFILDLVAAGLSRVGLGTKVTVVAGPLRAVRWLQCNAWRGFQDPIQVHVGFGAAAVADSLIVQWPSGSIQTFVNLAAGRYSIVEGVTAAPEAWAGAVATWTLEGATPQPGSGIQRFMLRLADAVDLEVTVRDVAGRTVRELHRGRMPSGPSELGWDGTDARGRRVASGVYWIRATDGRRTVSTKAIRIR